MKNEEKKIVDRFDIFTEGIVDLFPAEDIEETLARFDYIEKRIIGLFPEDRKGDSIFGE